MSVGHGAAADYRRGVRPERAIAYPTGQIEVYPASMTLFDIAIAPSAENNLFRGKSDLRWLEASALGIPLVAHPDVYPDIEDGVTGVHASHAGRGRGGAAAADRRPRASASASARTAHEYVAEHRRIEVAAERWREVLLEVRAPVVAA